MNNQIEDFLLSHLEKPKVWREEVRACCPFHQDDTPSFFVYEKENFFWFKCFGCGKAGTLYYLLKRLGGTHLLHLVNKPEYDDSKKHREDKKDVSFYKVPDYKGYPFNNSYFIGRGLSQSICKIFDFRFDFFNVAAVMPIYTGHKYFGWIKRNLHPSDYRYSIEPGMALERAIWGYDFIDFGKPTVITEGQIDAATFWSQGVQALAIIGKNWQSKIDLLQRLEKPICVPDNDATSLDTFHNLSIAVSGKLLKIPPPYKDSNEYHMAGKDLKGLVRAMTF